MGYSMAVNLRSKMNPNATLFVCDVNEIAISKFVKENSHKGPIEIIKTGAEAVAKAVSPSICLL